MATTIRVGSAELAFDAALPEDGNASGDGPRSRIQSIPERSLGTNSTETGDWGLQPKVKVKKQSSSIERANIQSISVSNDYGQLVI